MVTVLILLSLKTETKVKVRGLESDLNTGFPKISDTRIEIADWDLLNSGSE